MINELGNGRAHTPFAIKEQLAVTKEMNIDVFKPVNLDAIPGGMDSIQVLVREALAKELVGLEELKKLSVQGDQLYLDGKRFVQSKEIFAD